MNTDDLPLASFGNGGFYRRGTGNLDTSGDGRGIGDPLGYGDGDQNHGGPRLNQGVIA